MFYFTRVHAGSGLTTHFDISTVHLYLEMGDFETETDRGTVWEALL